MTREASLGIRLLSDLKAIFGTETKLPTNTILDRLYAIEEAPWADLRGQPLNARGLAYRLSQYEVTSTKVRIGDTTLQGYRAEDLWDACSRYALSDPDVPEQAEHPEHPRSPHPASVPDDGTVPEQIELTEHDPPPTTRDVPPVPDVPAHSDRTAPDQPPPTPPPLADDELAQREAEMTA